MFTVLVASGQRQSEQKYLYPRDHPGKPFTQIKYYQQLKELKAGLHVFETHSQKDWWFSWSLFWIWVFTLDKGQFPEAAPSATGGLNLII